MSANITPAAPRGAPHFYLLHLEQAHAMREQAAAVAALLDQALASDQLSADTRVELVVAAQLRAQGLVATAARLLPEPPSTPDGPPLHVKVMR